MEAVNRESYVPAAPSLGSSGAGVADRLDAFAEGATPAALSGLADDLLAVAGLLGRVLGAPTAPVEQRGALVDDLLSSKAKATTTRLARLALTGFGGRSVAASLSRLVEMAAARRDQQIAYVTSAVPLSDEDEERLGAILSRRYGRPVSVKVTI